MDAEIAKIQAAAEYFRKLEEMDVPSLKKMDEENLFLNTKPYEILSK